MHEPHYLVNWAPYWAVRKLLFSLFLPVFSPHKFSDADRMKTAFRRSFATVSAVLRSVGCGLQTPRMGPGFDFWVELGGFRTMQLQLP